MSRFEQLQSAYKEATGANHRYWTQMHQALRGLQSDFCAFLGVDPAMHVPLNGAGTPVVAIGSYDDKNQFLNWSIDKLPRNDRTIQFALRITFGDSAQSVPAPTYIMHLQIAGLGDDLFAITVQNLDETEFKGPVFNEFFENVFQRAMSSLGK
jgi:hypothetical protein